MPLRDPFGWVGQTVAGKLSVEAMVAEGGFAIVYRATHLGFHDIKPSNLFIAQVGGRRLLKVLDFGIAKVMTDALTTSRRHAQTGATVRPFSPCYGAPEQFSRRGRWALASERRWST